MAERPLYTLYKNLKAQNYDVPDDYNKFESALTRDGKGGADNRHAIYENLKAQNFDVPNTYERFYSALFEPRSKTSSRAKGGSVPMSAADRARFSAGAAAISASAQHTMNNAGRYNRLKQRKQKQQKDFGRVNLGTHQTPYGGDANNVVKDDFAYNPETGKAGAYVSSDNENVYSQPEAEQKQAVLDQQNNAYQEAVDTGEIPSVFDVRDKNGNYDLQENINKNGTYLTEEGARNQFDKKLADAYARKKEIEALIAEDHRQHGNPLLSYGASIGASNGRTAEQSDYSNKLATSLALVKQQIGALEAVKQYPTSSWGEDALKALDNTVFTAKTWDFGLTDFATMGQMERIKTKMDNNLPLSGSDKMLLKSKLGADAVAALEDEKMGNIYRWTKIAGQSLPFMADFFLTGGYGGITKAISRGALKFAAKRGMGKVGAAILKNTGIVAGDVIGSYAMAGSEQAMKTGADIMQRHLGNLYQDEKGDYKFGTFDENGNLLHDGGESMGTALYKGLTSAMVENYTEKLFGHSYGIKKGAINFMEKHGMNASAEFFKNIGKSGWYTNSKKWMEKFGINGFGEEVMEEEIGIPLHALLDGDNKFSDLLDTKQQLDIIGGMALSVGSMYAMGAGSRPVKGVYNRAQYYRFRNKVNVADSDAQNLMGDKWADIKDKIDNTTNEQMGGVLADILRQRDTMSKDQINAAINYGINLMKMRGYNVAKTAEMNAREITNEPTTPEEQHQEDIDNAYSEGHDADDADKHDIQLEHEDQMKTLAGLLNISEQQLSAMNDDELQSLTGQNDKLDQAIYDYQLSSARYQGVTDDAQDKIDMAANQAAQRVDMYTDKSRGSVRNATVKASGGAEDYGVYIISGNIATNEDGSINVADSDDMILFYDPTTNSVEHADALRFAELRDEVPADDVKAQAVADAKEKAIKEVAGIVDGTIDVGSQFKVTGADGLEHTYEILADYGDGTAAISIDGNVVENPYSIEDLQQLKDLEDQKRLEAAKAQRELMEKERAEQQTQETELPEETQPSLDFNQILNDDGNVVLVDVLGKDGNTKYPSSQLFLIRDSGAKAKVMELKSDGTLVPHAVNKKDVRTATTMTLDEYKQAMAETSMIEENSGAIEGDRGGIEVNDELPPVPDNVTINGDGTYSVDGAVQGGENTTAPSEQTEQTPAMTLEDGTIVPMLEDGNPDFSKLTADQTAELYDSQFGEDADSVISGWVSDAKKALDKANNMTVKGKNFVEQKAAKEAKEKAIADAQAAYDSAIAIRDAYNSRQLAKVEDTAEGRKNLIEKARRKFSRLKSAVKDDAEAVSQLYKDIVGSLLHRLYDGTGIDVTDTIPLTAEEYVASNLGAHALNYEGTETSKGVKQETGLSREDFAKTQLLAADGKGTTIDDLVHSLWENRPSNLESLNTQDIRNALIDVLTSGFKASEARNYIENLRIAQAENILEEQKKAADNAAFAEEQKAKQEEEEKKAEEEKTEENTHSEAFNKIVDLAKKQKEYWDNPDGEMVDVAHEMDELLKTLSDEEFKEVSGVLENMDEEFEYWTADEHERREDLVERKNAKAYEESLKKEIKSVAPFADALNAAVKSGDKKAIAKAQKELTDALLASNLGHGYLSGQLAQAKMAKKKDESYSEKRAFVKPLTDAINAIESALDSALADAGLEGVHIDFKENGHGWIYADKGSAWSSRLKPLDNDYRNVSQYDGDISVLPQITMDNVAKVAGIIKSLIEEGERYNSDEYNDEENDDTTATEQNKFPDKLREGSKAIEVPEDATAENPLGAQLDQTDLPFSARDNGTQQTTSERAADVEKNKVDDMKVVDNIVGQKTRKAFERLAKMMSANIQWQYSDKLGNGWIQETTDADGNVHRTIFITLDSSITEGAQFIFGHEMTHQIKSLNPAAYNELTQLVLDTYGSDAFDKAVDETMQRYSDAGFSGRDREYYAEEVVADAVGEMIRDLNLAHTLAMKMSHPLLAAIHEILQKIKLAFYGTEYSDVTKNIIRSIEQAYVKTANGQVTNTETGEDVSFSLRQKPEPKKKGIGYKVFVLKDGKLYPPMVANPDGAATPVGVWLDADAAPIAGESKTGRPQVKQGGKGTQGGSGKLAYRPGWHLGVVPYAIQFNRKDAEGNKTLFPKNFVFAEVEYAADVDYQEEARQEGINPSGKYQHSLAGLKHLPTDGYYMYRTNPNPETDPWVITGAMKVNRILTRAEQAELVKNAGREPQQIQEGDIVTDDVVNSINQEIADAPKFSLKVYHGSGADFTEFDFDHMGEGAGSQAFGWGGYVTSSKKIGKSYATLMDNDPSKAYYRIQRSNGTRFAKKYPTLESFLHGDKKIAMNDKFTEQEKIDFYNEMKKLAEPYHNLYEVDIPEDNGSNYLDWDAPITDELIDKVAKALPSLRSYDIKDFKKDRTFDNFYKTISMRSVKDDASFNDDKAASKLLASLGYTGIKYKAGRNFGGAEEGDTNYVILKPEDMRITEHTKFSLKDPFKMSDNEKKERGDRLIKAPAIDVASGVIQKTDELSARKAAEKWWKENVDKPLVFTTEVGDVVIDEKSIKDSLAHRYNQAKLDSITSLPVGFGNSVYIGTISDFVRTRDNVQNHYFAYPINYDGQRNYVFCRAMQDTNKNRLYVHEVFVADKINEGNTLQTAASKPHGGIALYKEILANVLSAAKIDNSSETAKENGEKFSLKDEKTMFGMHNISIDKLRKAIKQGGFAAPSMGVVDSKNGIYSDYGEITLIPKAEKLAKRTGKNAGTFTADAWTPTYPQVERIMNKQGEKAFNTDMNVKLGDVDNGIYSNVRESWKGYLSSGDVRDGLYWHYLFDKGMNPETIYQTGKYDNDITNEVMRISDNGNKTDYTDKEVAELIQLMNKATGKDNDVDAQREKLKARIASAEKQGNHLLVALKKKRLEELEGVENFYIAADFVNDVVRNNRKNGKVDVHDTMGAAKKKVEDNKKLSDDFPSWLDKKTEEYGVEEMLYNGTTPSGKPKYIPNTIDNAVKLMKKQGVAGGYTAFGSELGVFIAKNSPEVNTLAAMKNAKDKLIPFGDERHNQIKDKITKEFLELSDEIRVGSNNRYAFDDSGVSRMVELTDHKGNEKEYLKKAYNIEVSDEWMDRYNKLLDTIKKDYKVFYFETKFMRPYGLDEFEKAIVPSDTPSDVVDALKKAGIDVSSYERGNAEDRQKVTMDAINSSDNIRFSLAGERGAAAADKAEERTARMDNLSVARKMEEEKKDANAIKMATGWERGADGKWRYEMPDAKINDTMDVGGGHIVKRYEDDMLWNGGKLSKVIDAPELFKAYPQLKDVRIETDAIMNDMPSNGEYNAKTNTITIHADELKYMNSILNHEIQHAIQSIEGFDRGGSPRLVRGEIKNRLAEVTKQIRQLRAEGKEDEAKAIVEKNRGLYNAYQANDDYNSYKSLAGEVEARNVQERMNMTPEERRKSLAESTEDVARKDQIFLGVGDVSFSLRDMADGKESAAADMAEDLKSLNTPGEVDDAIKTAIDDMPSGWRMANRKMIHIAQALGENRKAEIAGKEPKFSLKDGTLIKAGTYFSGGGLVEEGLKGIIDPVVAVEYDEKISGVYRNNFGQHIVTADVRDVDPKELVKQINGEVEYFHASPVCKNYSQAKSNHSEVELDKETAASTAEFINAVKPKVVTIENVKGYKDSEAMKIITDALDANGYTWDADVYNAADYGGYTNRERLIVRAVRDGKLPAKPKKMAHKSGWYEAVADIIPTLTEKKNGVAPWMDIRLKADGIDWRNIDKPLYVMGSAYADGKVPHAFADELLPTLRTKSGDVIVMPDGKVYRAMGRVLARVSGVSDDYKMPFSENLSHTIIGNGIPTQLTEHVIAPLLTGSDPKFSIRTYHGTGASFDKFDLSHALEGEGSESFGHGVYVTNSSKIGREYAQRAKNRKMEDLYKNMRYPDGVKGDIFKRRVFGEMVNDVATGGSVASAKEFAKKRVGADANDILRTLENLKDREKGTEYEQNLKDRLAEYKEGLKWIDSLDEDYLTQGNANRYDVDIPDDNGSNYLDWEGTIPDSLDKQKVAEDAYKVLSDNQGFNDFKATPLNDFIAHTLKTYVNTTDVAGRVEKLKSDIKDVIENYVADEDVLALNEYLKDATPDDVLATIWYNDLVKDIKDADLGEELYRKLSTYVGDNAASQILSDNGLVGIKYPAGLIHGGAKEGDYNYVIFDENNANIVGNTRFSLRYDKFEHDLNQWKKDNNLPKDAQRPTIPQRNAGESAVDFLRRVDEYRKMMALWKTAPTYEQHLLSDDTALGEFNRELQRGSVLKRIAFQDSMLAIRKAQEAIMKEVGVDRLNMAEDAYTAENRSHGKGKNEFEEYNNEFLQPLRKAYHQMKKVLGDSYDNVRVYMMAKHGLERDAQMAFKKSLEADYEDVNQRSAAYKAYKNDLDRVSNDADLEFGRVDFTTWRQKDNALRGKYSPSYIDYRYDDNGIAYDYSGLSSLFDGSDFEEAAHKLVRDVETKHLAEVQALWNATNAATKKILRDGFKAGMMSKDAYEYVKGMYSHYIPLRGWDGTTADQVWDYIGGGKGAFNQPLKTAHGRTSIADDPIAYIENMAESGILLNNKNWVKQHLMLLAQNYPTSLLTLSKAWYVKSTDANGNEEWIPATPQITSQMNSNQVKAAIDAFEQKMEQMAQTGDATQQRDGLNIAYPQTHSEEREHEVRVMKDGEEYVIYVNGDPQLAQAMNNTRAHRVREIQSGKLDRAAAWLGRKMAAAYTSLSPLFIPSNYFRDLTMTLASTAIREDGRYNYLLRKNLATSWNLGFMLRDYQNGKLREKVSNGNATAKEQMFYDFMMNGGETGFVSSLDVEDLKKKFKNDLKDLDRWKANPVKVGHTIMDGIEFLNRAIEDSNRFAVYMTSIQYGRSIDEAVNDAKDVTLNFNRKGTGEYGWQMVRNLYLFINPAVQSLQTLGALAKHHPFKFTAVTASWLASGVLVPIVNAALMSLLGGDDDKDKYWQFTKWDRRNNLIMWVPFTHEYVKIPLAQEFRAFYGVGDMIASKMMGGELAEESWNQYAEDLLGQVVDMLPLDPTGYDGNIAVSLMPNAIRPVFELAFNVDFTGKPLFKDTEYNKYDPNFTKAYVGTPDWLVRVSKMVNSIGNDYPDVQQNAIDAFGDPRYNLNNPAVVDHVLSSYLGGAYTMGSQVLGVLTKSLNDPKEIKMADIPLVSKFVSNPDDRPVTKKQGDEFWNMKENHDRAANTLSKLKKQAKVDGDYSMLERFYGSEEYKQYKQEDVKVKKYEEDKKKERAEESGEEYRPHKLNAEDIYKAHATPKDDFEDLKLKQLYTKLNGFKSAYDLLVDTAPSQSDGYYNTNKAAIDAIDEISLDKQEISELKKGFLEDGKDAYNAEDMKRIRELRKRILSVLEPANKVVVANQKAKAEKK